MSVLPARRFFDRRFESADAAVADVADGAVLLVGGFGSAGVPVALVEALARRRPRGLTVVTNNAGQGAGGVAALLRAGCVRKVVCSYPRVSGSVVFQDLYRRGAVELELVPQGTLAERLRCAGAGLGGFYSPVGPGTVFAAGRELRSIGGTPHLLEPPLPGDVALVKARRADWMGNLAYAKSARNFNPVMATAAALTIAEADQVVEVGALDPEEVVTPCIFVRRVVASGGA